MSDIATATPPHQRRQPQRDRLLLLIGILVAFALRLFHLGSESLWYDETVSVVLARKSIPALLAHTAGDIHPPGYYLLLHFWQQLTMPSLVHGLEFLFAWPSLWCGIVIVALIYALGRRLSSPQIALLALWLTAVHPYQIWYSQEVRMYTLGALLGLLALWALLNFFAINTHPSADSVEPQPTAGERRWLICYALCGALGLYTLYYFLFLLLSLNVIALWWLFTATTAWSPTGAGKAIVTAQHRRLARGWVGAQIGLFALWLPWLPIFWRQATDPPVPPWRAPWHSVADVIAALSESASALLSGQSAPAATHWIWLLIGLFLLAATSFIYTKHRQARAGLLILLLYTLLPLATIFVISLVVAPIYHVRYLMLYAPPLVFLPAALLHAISRHNRPLGWLMLLLFVTVNGWSLRTFWFDPRYQSDDQRAAVAQLAAGWRPGDVILVNAGWVYTALETYWPTELIGADAALPPALEPPARLHDYANKLDRQTAIPLAPVIVRTGSVDGNPNLGWGDPASDFFALDADATTAALQTLRQHYQRLWHYRLYDTVNDPAGQIRAWLDQQGTLLLDQPIAGRDFLRLQLYAFDGEAISAGSPVEAQPAQGVDGLRLIAAQPLSTTVEAGNIAYVATRWQRTAGTIPLPPIVSFSLRLYDDRGVLVAQQDERPLRAPQTWSTSAPTVLTLALPIAVATQPGTYTLQLLPYDGATGAPLGVIGEADGDTMLTLGTVTVAAASRTPELGAPLVRFDYIDLVQLQVAQQTVNAGAMIPINLLWLPQPNTYQDTYVARWMLRDQTGVSVQSWEEALGSWRYPSGNWPTDRPVRQQTLLGIAPSTAAGTYQLTLQVVRHSDGQSILPRQFSRQILWWQRATTLTMLPDDRLFVAEILIQ